MKALLQTENEGKLGLKLWSRLARFFCAFALNIDEVCFLRVNNDNKNILLKKKRQKKDRVLQYWMPYK